MPIYFDNSATTRPFDFVAERVKDYSLQSYFNPSSLYAGAVQAARDIQNVRQLIARDLRVGDDEIVFTSGGTESNNSAILGVALAQKQRAHFVTSAIEHSSVYEVFEYLQRVGNDVTFLPCDSNGVVRQSTLLNSLRNDTVMVSIMHVNNEVGSVMDIANLAKTAKKHNPRCVFHSDGVQAYPKIVSDLSNVDLYSISGHKFHAPRGVGALVCKKGVRLQSLLTGGGQENTRRSGTENTPGIVGLGIAQQYFVEYRVRIVEHLQQIKQRLQSGIEQIEHIRINSPDENAAPHILSVSFEGIRGEALVHALEQKQIYVGTGSACSSHKKGANRILSALGVEDQYARGTIRFSFSCMNTPEESDVVAKETAQAVEYLRRFQRR